MREDYLFELFARGAEGDRLIKTTDHGCFDDDEAYMDAEKELWRTPLADYVRITLIGERGLMRSMELERVPSPTEMSAVEAGERMLSRLQLGLERVSQDWMREVRTTLQRLEAAKEFGSEYERLEAEEVARKLRERAAEALMA